MTGASVSPRKDNISVKHRKITLVQAPSGPAIANFDYADVATSENDKRCHRNSDPQSSQMLCTADLKSAIGYAWDQARWPRSVPQSEPNLTCKAEVVKGADTVHYSTDKGALRTYTSAEDQPCAHDLNSKTNLVQQLQESRESSKRNQNMSIPQPSCKPLSSWGRILARSTIIDDFPTSICLLHTGIPPNWGSVYSWMNQIPLSNQRNQVNFIENQSPSEHFTDNCSTNSDCICELADVISTADTLTSKISGSKSETAKPLDLSFASASNIDMKTSAIACSKKEIMHGQHIEATDCNVITSGCGADFEDIKLASPDQYCENDLHEHQENQEIMSGLGDSEMNMGLEVKEKPKYALAKQEHAFAGAMAGIFVSLCLHPIDTVKTVLQSCRADQKPIYIIGSSIIAERGMFGLYRGISSNIVSSAPISAIYTYTYESVKKNLLPLLPKEYYSLAHCTSGGCASIATSFIFTPSERIKQQMQVGSHYRNCWNAFIHIVQKGGVPSLYAGWGAVLCRNIPHSVIKFYTYERLKQMMLPSVQLNAQANVYETLVCGGLAGSVASLFTTPFDVVKTRLQTQVPGSMTKYTGVLTTLTEIGKHEGLQGLYRGLTPRLVMYMVQGALFFASYESFKQLFSLEVQQLSAQTLHSEQKSH